MEYFTAVVRACNDENQYRKFGYGGAIRGGKTWVTLAILAYLCKRYPGSKWVCIRKDFPSLQKTTIESITKMLAGSPYWKWRRAQGDVFIQHSNGARIYFMGENIDRDKELNKFLGMECNGIFYEQLEELTETLWEIGSSRVGSWYIDPMPPAFVFTTFNPSQRWLKEKIWARYIAGTLPPDFYYQEALPRDNPFVTQDQWNTWEQMDSRYQAQYIAGDWTDFDDTDPRWAYAFDEGKHVRDTLPFLPSFPVYLSFDFNRDPLTCVAMQMTPQKQQGQRNSFVHFLREFTGPVQLKELCTQIKTAFPSSILFVTGDASGNKGDVGYDKRNDTHYRMIARYLRLSPKQLNKADGNLEHHDSRLLVNTLLYNYPNLHFSGAGCPTLIHEYKHAKVDENSSKPGHLKKDRAENKLDLFDGSRYFFQTYFKKYVDLVFLSNKKES